MGFFFLLLHQDPVCRGYRVLHFRLTPPLKITFSVWIDRRFVSFVSFDTHNGNGWIESNRIGLLAFFFRSIAVTGWMHGSRNAKPRKTDSYIHRCTSLSTDGECLVDLARQTHTYIQKSKHKLNSSRLNFM